MNSQITQPHHHLSCVKSNVIRSTIVCEVKNFLAKIQSNESKRRVLSLKFTFERSRRKVKIVLSEQIKAVRKVLIKQNFYLNDNSAHITYEAKTSCFQFELSIDTQTLDSKERNLIRRRCIGSYIERKITTNESESDFHLAHALKM
jgi:hypothetical protein